MPKGGSKPGERRGGRKAGTPNKLTVQMKATLRETAEQFTERALQTLVEIMEDKEMSANARTRCAEILLDRGHGKALQVLEHAGKDGGPIQVMATDEDRVRALGSLLGRVNGHAANGRAADE